MRTTNLAIKSASLLTIAATVWAGGASPASAQPVGSARIVAHFDLAAGQQAENIVAAPDGAVDVTFAAARQVARVSKSGQVKILATLPAPPARAKAPVLGFPLTTGLERLGDDRYVLYATGDAGTTGLWRIRTNRVPTRLAALPASGLPNGLAFDAAGKTLFVADSVRGVIDRVSVDSGRVTTWATGAKLVSGGFLGVNGVRVHGNALYATNLDQGTLLRIPFRSDGSAGRIRTAATGLNGIDDFAFVPGTDRVLAAIDPTNDLVEIDANGSHRTVLTRSDGLSNPTAVLVRGQTAFITSAAYVTQQDPNLLTINLPR
jgi:hypothetical protein